MSGGTPSGALTPIPAKTAGPAVPRLRPAMSLLLRCSPGGHRFDHIFRPTALPRPHPAGVKPGHPRALAARGMIRHGDRARVGDRASARRGPIRPRSAQRGRERGARRPHPRLRHLRRVPHAHGTRPCRPAGERGPGPARLRSQRAARPRPGHSRSGRRPAGHPREARHRPGGAGRELDGVSGRPRGGARGTRAGRAPRPGLPGRGCRRWPSWVAGTP